MSTSSHPDVRARLDEAEAYLSRARNHLDASPPDYAGALGEVMGSFRASFTAFLIGYGATPDPDTPIAVLSERAVRNDSVLKTAAHRAVLLAERASAIEQASSRPSVNDREDVETGWYTARNLHDVVVGRLSPGPPSA